MVWYIKGVIDHIWDPEGRRLPCSAGSSSFFLPPRNIYPFIIMDLKMGNICERILEEI